MTTTKESSIVVFRSCEGATVQKEPQHRGQTQVHSKTQNLAAGQGGRAKITPAEKN